MPEYDWLAVHVTRSHRSLLRGVHVLIEVNGLSLLNTFHDGFSHLVGAHPDPFFAPGSALWASGREQAYLPIGDPVDCQPECCGAGARVWREGQRVRWRLIGDRWNRDLPSAHLEFDREEYLFTLQCARDQWLTRSTDRAALP